MKNASTIRPLRASIDTIEIKRDGTRTVTSEELPKDRRSDIKPEYLRLGDYFESVFADTAKRLTFKPQWLGSTGYLDGLQHDEELSEELELGERAAFVDPHGRRALVINTPFGCACVFERYTDTPWTLVKSVPVEITRSQVMESGGCMTESQLRDYLLMGAIFKLAA